MTEHFLLIGACGWEYPQWDGEFYPDDLPPEWRLGFYGNEFPLVLIPARAWQQGMSAVQTWLDETHDAPDFICELPTQELQAGDYEQVLAMIRLLGRRVLAISITLDRMPDMDLLAYLSRLEQLAPLVLDTAAAEDPQQLANAMQQQLHNSPSLVWHGEADKQPLLVRGELAVARIGEAMQQPRALRAVIEALLATAERKSRLILLFDGNPPSLKQMRAAGVILDLL